MMRVFESCGFEYKVLRPINYGREGEPVLLAARREYFGDGDDARRAEAAAPRRLRNAETKREGPAVGGAAAQQAPASPQHRRSARLRGRRGAPYCRAGARAWDAPWRRSLTPLPSPSARCPSASRPRWRGRCRCAGPRPSVRRRAGAPPPCRAPGRLTCEHPASARRGQVKLVNFGSAYSELIERYRTPDGVAPRRRGIPRA